MKHRPIWASDRGPRPKQIETKTIVVDGKQVQVRVFAAAGDKEGIRPSRYSPGLCSNMAAFASAQDEDGKRRINRRLKKGEKKS